VKEEDVTRGDFKPRAYAFYRELRRSTPVHPVQLPDGQRIWLVTRYDDVASSLKDERLFKDKRKLSSRKGLRLPGFLRSLETLERNMLDVDAPDHSRLRQLVHRGFTPKRVAEMGPRIEHLADELLWNARKKGTFDLIEDYALPIPTTIIAEMMGIPAEDRRRFHRWTGAIVAASASRSVLRPLPSLLRFVFYLKRAIARKRREPADDLLSALVEVEESSDRLSSEEVLAMAFLLVVAGHETTVNLIANGVLALLENPEQLERLRGEPALYPRAVEELLRFDGPVEVATERYPREPIELAGTVIPRHELVGLVLASANRDERQFAKPDDLDLGREPNQHLAFGDGIHFCLGAPLARLEGRIALEKLVATSRTLKLAVPLDELRFKPGLNLRGLVALPVELARS
jgi:cytochrome P450 PksS